MSGTMRWWLSNADQSSSVPLALAASPCRGAPCSRSNAYGLVAFTIAAPAPRSWPSSRAAAAGDVSGDRRRYEPALLLGQSRSTAAAVSPSTPGSSISSSLSGASGAPPQPGAAQDDYGAAGERADAAVPTGDAAIEQQPEPREQERQTVEGDNLGARGAVSDEPRRGGFCMRSTHRLSLAQARLARQCHSS
jgi:hypothetical protein